MPAKASRTAGPDTLLPAPAVIELLGIKPQTLYAYVARGWIRGVAQAGRKTKLYMREDVERLRLRSQARAGHGATAAAALHWGQPVVATALTEITSDGPRYRGRLATELAAVGVAYETTAELLWTGLWQPESPPWQVPALPPEYLRIVRAMPRASQSGYADRVAALVHLLNDVHGGQAEAASGSLLPPAREILQVAAGAISCLRSPSLPLVPRAGERIAGIAARAVGCRGRADVIAALDFALTLTADHELTPSTFIARIVASAGGGIHACLAAGASGFHGPLAGAGADSLAALVLASRSRPMLLDRLKESLDRGIEPGGFNHPLYPHGDPRARAMLEYVARLRTRSPKARLLLDAAAEAEAKLGLRPALATGLVALQLAFDLPYGMASALNLLGRLAGMTAHVQEQRMTGTLIRPRARYTA